ncbi:hypothetical protein ACWV95_13165 [Streptomyces albus]
MPDPDTPAPPRAEAVAMAREAVRRSQERARRERTAMRGDVAAAGYA